MSKTSNNLIGVFDSGLGGLSVLKNLLDCLPNYHYIYLGDTAHVPYGDKPAEEIYKYTVQAVNYLFKKDCRLVIIACNTASAQALRRLQRDWLPINYPERRVLGVIRPLAEASAKDQINNIVGIIGTQATIKSGAYTKEIKDLNSKIKIYEQATPLLVPLIEAGKAKEPETKLILENYLKPLQDKKIKSLILACTHYPYLQKEIKKIMGPKVKIPDTGKIIALSLKKYLRRHPELLVSEGKSACHFYTTGQNKNFKKQAEKFLKKPIKAVKQIKL